MITISLESAKKNKIAALKNCCQTHICFKIKGKITLNGKNYFKLFKTQPPKLFISHANLQTYDIWVFESSDGQTKGCRISVRGFQAALKEILNRNGDTFMAKKGHIKVIKSLETNREVEQYDYLLPIVFLGKRYVISTDLKMDFNFTEYILNS